MLVKIGNVGVFKKATNLHSGFRALLPPLFGPNPDYTEHQRDPKIIHNEKTGKYYLIIGAQTREKKGCVIIYRSDAPTKGWAETPCGSVRVNGPCFFASISTVKQTGRSGNGCMKRARSNRAP